MLKEPGSCSPNRKRDQDGGQSEYLTNFDTDIETHNIRDEAGLCERELLKLRCETKSVKETEDQNGELGIRLESEQALKPAHIVEGFIYNGKPMMASMR
jgi:hypothetical protein